MQSHHPNSCTYYCSIRANTNNYIYNGDTGLGVGGKRQTFHYRPLRVLHEQKLISLRRQRGCSDISVKQVICLQVFLRWTYAETTDLKMKTSVDEHFKMMW